MSDLRKIVGITLGDPAGVGPEVAMKAAISEKVSRHCRVVLFGDRRALDRHATACKMPFAYRVSDSVDDIDWSLSGIPLIHTGNLEPDYALGEVAAANGAAAVAALDAGIAAALDGGIAALVGAPIHEVAIQKAGVLFDGHPSYLAKRTGTPAEDVFLMLCYGTTRIAHTTLHLSVRGALELITRERVGKIIVVCDRALRQLGIAAPRIGVSGLNPHAGEAGMFGREEIDIIEPAVRDAASRGIGVIGPIGADTLLPRTDCDAFIVMLHDQGHVPAKLASPHAIAALSVGTPVLFSSVGHGTAMDIVGQGTANADAMIHAIFQVSNAVDATAARHVQGHAPC